jgi:hypothetical protein
MMILEDRILLHLQGGRRIPVDPREIYLLEAEGGETLVRTRQLSLSNPRIADPGTTDPGTAELQLGILHQCSREGKVFNPTPAFPSRRHREIDTSSGHVDAIDMRRQSVDEMQ